MTRAAKAKSPILEAVHETAGDLHRLGFIDMRKMRSLRKRFQLSQAALASILNTSLSTIRQWEIDGKHPSGPSRKLLSLLERNGLESLI